MTTLIRLTMICLDTNVVVGVLNRRPPRLKEIFNGAVVGGEIALSAICLFELEYGIAKSRLSTESASRLDILLQMRVAILPFEREDAREAGDIRAVLEKAGTPIGPYDILIAAQARRREATLVTANTREFARVPGLKLEDWTRD